MDGDLRLKPRESISGQTEDLLKDLIMNGTLAPGTRLNEVEIATRLGISRGPVREAIQRIAAQGLLELSPGRGARVRTFEPKELLDLYELREAVEVHIAGLAAERIGTEDLRRIEEMLRQSEEAIKSGEGYPSDLNHDFHLALARSTNNRAMVACCTGVLQQLSLARLTSGGTEDRAWEALKEHKAILRAVKRGRVAAMEAMRAHIRSSANSAVPKLLR